MLNIVIPMAGRGSRFANAGYKLPKPLIPVHGIPMIKVVIDNLAPKCEHRFIFICQNEAIEKFNIDKQLRSFTQDPVIVGIDGITEGQVCSVLLAKKFLCSDDALMTANCDQFIDFDINEYLDEINSRKLDGMIMTMKSSDPKWSYARIDENGFVTETAEKKVISDQATVGIYNFSNGKDFIAAAEEMISDNIRVNGELYTCPVYNYLIRQNKKIGVFSIGEEYNGMYGLGIPKDLDFFISNPISNFLKGDNL